MAAMQMTITATGTLFLVITFIVILISLNTEAKELGNNCEIKISPDVNMILSRLVRSDKKVFNFEVHLSDKKLDDLLNPVRMDYFANARQFTWIPNEPDGLIAYKNFYYDFSMRSLNLLGAYIATPRIDIDINCGKQNIQRHDLIYLIFGELKRIVFIDTLKIGESGYMCFLINLSQDMKKNSPESFKAYRRLGINRELAENYCCKLYKNGSNVYHPKSICSGNIMEHSMYVNYANITFSKVAFGSRSQCGPKKRYKDTRKTTLEKYSLGQSTWKRFAKNGLLCKNPNKQIKYVYWHFTKLEKTCNSINPDNFHQ
ncbi:uncharacterized protein LOC128249435 [Octopus bimaculoides]|uniref:uncharacterized protein LOC128249435 n=1 Tax=Octopus bimaculoides TaxID=37653 RepID=UPI0022E45070|nr:uncharacterized protein LOC128249435 [Octopus bimaculoides]